MLIINNTSIYTLPKIRTIYTTISIRFKYFPLYSLNLYLIEVFFLTLKKWINKNYKKVLDFIEGIYSLFL